MSYKLIIIAGITLISICMLVTGIVLANSFRRKGDQVYIRIHNNTGQDIQNFWIGAIAKHSRSIGSIKNNARTDYKSFDRIRGTYIKANFVTVDNKRYIANIPDEYKQEEQKLEVNGYYTFSFSLENEQSIITVTKDR